MHAQVMGESMSGFGCPRLWWWWEAPLQRPCPNIESTVPPRRLPTTPLNLSPNAWQWPEVVGSAKEVLLWHQRSRVDGLDRRAAAIHWCKKQTFEGADDCADRDRPRGLPLGRFDRDAAGKAAPFAF